MNSSRVQENPKALEVIWVIQKFRFDIYEDFCRDTTHLRSQKQALVELVLW